MHVFSSMTFWMGGLFTLFMIDWKVWFGIGVVLLIGIVLHIRRATAPLVETASRFFEAMARHDLVEARTCFSQRLALSEERSLKDFLLRYPFSEYSKGRWRSRSIINAIGQNAMGQIEGFITLKNGTKLPMKVIFGKEDGAWKIVSLEKPGMQFGFETDIGFSDD